jgi:polyisoprenoid-binding protein YceI
MNRIFFHGLIFLVLAVALISPLQAKPETYAIDPVHSSVFFKVGHAGFGFVRGRFNDFSGTIVRDRDNPENSQIDVVIKADSIDTANARRDEHLKSPDFFDAKKFPVMSFKSRSVEKLSYNTYALSGDFLLHGVTQRIRVKVKFIGEGKDQAGALRVGAGTEFSIKRSDYGMTGSIPAAGDMVDITVILEALPK